MTAGVRDKVSGILFFRSPFSRQVKSHFPEPSMCLYRAKLRAVDIKITTQRPRPQNSISQHLGHLKQLHVGPTQIPQEILPPKCFTVKSEKQQTTTRSALAKLRNRRPKESLQEGRGKPCPPAFLKASASSQRSISGKPTGLVSLHPDLSIALTHPPLSECEQLWSRKR